VFPDHRVLTSGLARRLSLVLMTAVLAALGPRAQALTLHFWPANISVRAKPGQIINRTFNLTLSGKSAATRYKARIEDWWRSADNSSTFYAAPGTLGRSCGNWCSVNPIEAEVKPGEKLTVRVSLRVPDDAQPGGYWAALTLDEVPDPTAPKPAGVGMILRGSVAMGIFVEVPDAKRSARLTAIKVVGDRVSVTVCNDGNMPLRINPTFEFYRPGEEKAAAKVELPGEPLLPEPNSTCEFGGRLPPPTELPSGKYRIRVIVDAGLDYLMGAEKTLDITRTEPGKSPVTSDQ